MHTTKPLIWLGSLATVVLAVGCTADQRRGLGEEDAREALTMQIETAVATTELALDGDLACHAALAADSAMTADCVGLDGVGRGRRRHVRWHRRRRRRDVLRPARRRDRRRAGRRPAAGRLLRRSVTAHVGPHAVGWAGPPLSTTSDQAATRYRDGVAALVAGIATSDHLLAAAVDDDPDFVLAHVARAVSEFAAGGPYRPAHSTGIMQRGERQHVEIVNTALAGRSPHAPQTSAASTCSSSRATC